MILFIPSTVWNTQKLYDQSVAVKCQGRWYKYVVESKGFRPDIQAQRQIENAVKDI